VTRPAADEARETLASTWGGIYGIGRTPCGGWAAVSLDGQMRSFEADSPGALEVMLRADEAAAAWPAAPDDQSRAVGMPPGGIPPGPAARDGGEALETLRYHWGDAYDIGVGGGQWTARRRDGLGGILADPAPGGLRERITADYEAMPVPRDAR
jgi:hypothetical protein